MSERPKETKKYYPNTNTIKECDDLLRVLYKKANRRSIGKSKVTVVKKVHYDRIEELKAIKKKLEDQISNHEL